MNLFLIAHKVRGEPAFDVATQLRCPECYSGCSQCDGLGYWWIIPTSGHRAYPYWDTPLPVCDYNDSTALAMGQTIHWPIPPMPPSLPDHYQLTEAPPIDISSILKPKLTIQRRF